MIGAALLTLAGCSSSTPQYSPVNSVQSESVTSSPSTTDSAINTPSNTVSQDLGSQGDHLVEVEIQKPANLQYAFQEDQDSYNFDIEEVARYQNENGGLVVLRDWEDNEYEIIAIERTQGIVYSGSEVQEGQLKTILNLLGTLNVPIN